MRRYCCVSVPTRARPTHMVAPEKTAVMENSKLDKQQYVSIDYQAMSIERISIHDSC